MKRVLMVSIGTAALLLVACSKDEQTTKTANILEKAETQMAGASETSTPTGASGMSIADALAHAGRPAKDRNDDASRKPGEVLKFAGVNSGMKVVELEAGSGYYTELLSRIVGEKGEVIMQNPHGFDAFIKPEVWEARLGPDGKRLPNVTHVRSNFDVLDVPDGSADLVTWILGPHELWLKNPKGELDLGAPEAVYAEINRVLKPGGKLLLLDHDAADGAPESTGGDTHRIDENAVRNVQEMF